MDSVAGDFVAFEDVKRFMAFAECHFGGAFGVGLSFDSCQLCVEYDFRLLDNMKQTKRNEVVFVGDDLAFVQLEHLRIFEADGLDEQLIGFNKRMDVEVVVVFELKRQGNELVK